MKTRGGSPKAIHGTQYGLIGLVVLAAVVVAWLLWPRSSPALQASLVAQAAPADVSGFARAEGPREIVFPADRGPHNDYQTEWWYYTGNLTAETGEHFGFQLTFFRRALVPPGQRAERDSAWGTDQVYMAHFALTDVNGGRHYSFERLARGAAGVAGAQAEPYRVWLEDWEVAEITSAGNVAEIEAVRQPPLGSAGHSGLATQPAEARGPMVVNDDAPWRPRPVRLRAAAFDPRLNLNLSLDLTLTDLKPPVLQGDRGYSRKGPEPGNASYYVSCTRSAAEGTVTVRGKTFTVSGLSWMDQEWSTSALGPEQVGWDWFSIQLDDESELMVFQLRRADGGVDAFSSGTLVAADGSTRQLGPGDFTITPTGTWRSPRSGGVYPAGWELTVPAAGLRLEIAPWLADQEMQVSYTYWEGAVRVTGTAAGRPVTGNGYVELTGYAGSMQGEF
ncbi:MAG: lipocalin-like domain-containing protein [Anaerolineae bacterium]